ncbi:MAG TPA: DUF4350 domain-containing protein [Puia sp.]|jgi:hypothetical protein|nr:DUF4350 domain-containing protein [Puia sp.]
MRERLRTIAAFVLLLPLASCQLSRTKQIDRRITLKRRDQIPYGTKVAYDGLSYLFPNATISGNNKPISGLSPSEGKKVYLVIGGTIDPSPADINSLLDFVGEGNHVFVSSRRFGDSLLHTLGVKASYGYLSEGPMDSLRVSLYHPLTGDSLSFAYPGDSYDGWVDDFDPQFTTVLGRDHVGRPNFIRFNYKGGGTLYLHFAPLAFSNFFLLHKKNISYYQDALSYLPATAQEVIWDDYFTNPHRDWSALGFILNNKSLAFAFWLVLLLFLLIYMFESKRRQRPIPVILPLQNTSLDFVRTIGRLYFQRRDNHNLASKMVMHFQDLVRTRYNLTATALDEEMASRLAHRTGYQQEALSRLVGYMRVLPSKAYVPDEELMDFHLQLEAFYKKA